MTLFTTASPARSDLPVAAGQPLDAARPAQPRHPYRRHGLVLAAGATAWSLGIMAFGANPTGTLDTALYAATSGLFQVGLLHLLRVLWLSQALGSGRVAKTFLAIENLLVVLAIGSTAADGFGVSQLDQPAWALLDATWPLSMVGMFAIAIRIAIAGRWRGVTRFWPLVAESWAVVVIPTMMVLGETVANYVAFSHLLVGYTVLGVLVARKRA